MNNEYAGHEEEVDLAEVPDAVKLAIEKEIVDGGVLNEIVKQEAVGLETRYLIKYTKRGVEKTADFTGQGRRL